MLLRKHSSRRSKFEWVEFRTEPQQRILAAQMRLSVRKMTFLFLDFMRTNPNETRSILTVSIICEEKPYCTNTDVNDIHECWVSRNDAKLLRFVPSHEFGVYDIDIPWCCPINIYAIKKVSAIVGTHSRTSTSSSFCAIWTFSERVPFIDYPHRASNVMCFRLEPSQSLIVLVHLNSLHRLRN